MSERQKPGQHWHRKSTERVPADWLSVSQAAALIALTPTRIRQLREEGRFRQTRQNTHGQWFIAPCCVRAELNKELCECAASPRNDDGKDATNVA